MLDVSPGYLWSLMMGRVPSRGSDQFVLRMPEGMRDRLREIAEANGRSMNSEIVERLSLSLALPSLLIPEELIERIELADERARAAAARLIVDDLQAYFPPPPPAKKVISFTTRQMVESLENSITKTPEMTMFLERLKEQMASGEIDGEAPAQFAVPVDYDAGGNEK